MAATWEQKLSCATECPRCKKALSPKDQRILSVYDDEAICLECKKRRRSARITRKVLKP